jgi:thiol:disulfide interchange protein DsbA
MPRCISVCLLALLVALAGTAFAQERDGLGYVTLPVQTKILNTGETEAAMFFWYGCGGCFRVTKAVAERGEGWPQGAALMRIPALGNDVWAFHGQIYLALEALGVPLETHLAVFDALQNKRLRVMERSDLPELVKVLGIDGSAFMRAFDSPEVAAKMDEANRISAAYDVSLVPAMVVDGQYKFDLGTVAGPDDFIRMAEELIAKSAAK